MSACPNCGVLADEIIRLRAMTREQVDLVGYNEFHTAIEFSRSWLDHHGERLYVHCEQAWGESNDAFKERYAKVREAMSRKYRLALRSAPVVIEAQPVAPPQHLFTGRLPA